MSIFLWVVMQRNVSRIIKNQYKSCLKSCQSIIHLHSLNHIIKLISPLKFPLQIAGACAPYKPVWDHCFVAKVVPCEGANRKKSFNL